MDVPHIKRNKDRLKDCREGWSLFVKIGLTQEQDQE